MSRNAYINKDIPLSKIHEVKADLKHYIEFYEKITFIEDIYAGETVKYAIEKRGKTIPTGHAWLKAWNEKGFDGLLRKKGSGRKTKLTENQFKQLKENIIKKQLTSVREVKHEIIEECPGGANVNIRTMFPDRPIVHDDTKTFFAWRIA